MSGKIRAFFKFLIDDFKSDARFVKKLWKGEEKIERNNLKELFSADYKEMIKKYWMFFLIVLLAFFCGYILATQRYEFVCNTIIDNISIGCNPWISGINIT